ncbi:MAG: tRNA (guanosine(37)-N1)-methyltransferase TrmD [Deltaproteobacteria bacterium]|nr:tRNA (guanosine(37)-N1)-methyltransferase TrmD [Deltaproteobacteria bacterium]
MNFVVLTIFPEMFRSFLNYGIIRRAIEQGQISAEAVNLRDFALDRHSMTDDRPYGGGCGMVMKPEPLAGAIRSIQDRLPGAGTVLLSPQGRPFDQVLAEQMAGFESMVLVCGRYEGVDERICQNQIDYEVSIGDVVLTGGELPAMMIIEAITRLIPGVLGGHDSAEKESFTDGLLEHAHYTRPGCFEGESVPDVLLSGNHRNIESWRLENAVIRTFLKRPDLLKNRSLKPIEVEILKKWQRDLADLIEAQSLCRPGSSSGGQ